MRFVLAAVLALAVPSFAQEIGSEINVSSPEPKNTATTGRTDATNTSLGHTPAKKGEAANLATGPQASAGKGMFGIHLDLMGVNLPTGATATSNSNFNPIPQMGFSYWLDNELAFLFNLGGAFGLADGGLLWGTTVSLGIDFHFRRVTEAIRPLINIEVGTTIPFAWDQFNNQAMLSIFGHFGGGAEYFFSPNFAVGGKVVVGLGLNLKSGALVVSTAPMMTAAWTF